MTIDDKVCLVQGILTCVEEDLISKIKKERIPAYWTGKEIRQLICDTLSDNHCFNLDQATKESYKNDRIIRRLLIRK